MTSFLDAIVGSFSTGADANPTVALMDAAFEDAGLRWRYVNCEVGAGNLTAAVHGARAMGWAGFNCSMPHKQAVVPLLDDLSPTAAICQAVNCVTRDENGWIGHNTDGAGFVASVDAIESVVGIEALMIGSGGAASAIAVDLARAGAATIHICGRSTERSTALAHLVERSTNATARVAEWSEVISIPDAVRLIANATPVGSKPHPERFVHVDWPAATGDIIAADIVMNPTDTAFLQHARSAGATTVDGTGMLVNQAAENIRLWTGISASTEIMRQALDASL